MSHNSYPTGGKDTIHPLSSITSNIQRVKRDPYAKTTYDALDMRPTLPPEITPGYLARSSLLQY